MTESNQQAKAPPTAELRPRIVVLGVGGAGGNAINNMIKANLEGVECAVANTDAQALAQSLCENRVQLGLSITQGLGAGSRPEIGRAAAEEGIGDVLSALDGAHMLFITAGMGGGTGTGAAPVIAQAAREKGILTVGVVTKPFHFEGVRRMKSAEDGIETLEQAVDTLIVIPNQNLFRIANEKTTFADAFKMADDVLYSGVRGVTDLMVMPGLINLDFADIRAVMGEMGKAMMGAGEAEGENRAVVASEAAIANPLLDDVSLRGAKGVLINITGGLDMTLYEVDEAANRIRDEVDGDANIIFGSTFDDALDGRVRVSVFATGIDAMAQDMHRPAIDRGHGVPIQVMTRGDGQSPHEPALSRAQDAARATVQRDMFVGEASTEPEATDEEPAMPEPAAATMQGDGEPWAGAPDAAQEPRIAADRAPEPSRPERRVEPRFDRSGRPVPDEAEGTEATATDPTQADVPKGRSVVDLVVEAASRDRAGRGQGEQARAEREPQPGPQPEVKPEPARTPEEDVLEIPAFLRRQAN